ncbi:MAG: ribonuclease HII [Elusimicrobia bacterium]|nr:ribonuclease HII [Candidatus Liberimonas magnetica]
MDLFCFDDSYRKNGCKMLAGIDEAGRGPWAGPVVAACVVLPPGLTIYGLDDSKKLSPVQREKIFKIINEVSLSVGVEVIDESVIDSLNILKATHLAMKGALDKIKVHFDLILVDGSPVPRLGVMQESIVKGDQKSACIAAASVVAKVTRDMIMRDLAVKYPEYYFDKHKGYGTKLHYEALKKYGPCPVHRKSFHPVRDVIGRLDV